MSIEEITEMGIEGIIEIIEEINGVIIDKLYEDKKEDEFLNEYENQIVLEFHHDGNMMFITFMGIPLWDTENDERIYIDINNDKQEPLRDFLFREVNSIIDSFKRINKL